MVETRRATWETLRSFISLRAGAAFTFNLSKRGYNGKIGFDHVKENLSIAVSNRNAKLGYWF